MLSLRKKVLAALPIMTTKRQGRVLAVRVDGDTLVIDGYNDGEYMGRYCMRKTGEYMSFVDGVWRQQKLSDMLSGTTYSYWGNYVSNPANCCTDAQKKLANAFLDDAGVGDGYTNMERRISYAEYSAMERKRDRALQRKIDRINARMEQVPVLPSQFEEWCKKVPFGDKQFMFPTGKRDELYCTACGKKHHAKTAKNNRPIFCSRTGKEAIVSKRYESREETQRVMIVQQVSEVERVARHFHVKSVWSASGQAVTPFEDIRYFLKPSGCTAWYYGLYKNADEFAQDWWDGNPCGKRTDREYCYPDGVRELLAGTVYENLGIPEMAEAGWRVWYNKIMICHGHTHYFEYLAKGGYQRLASEVSAYPPFISESKTTLEQVLKIDKQRANRLRQANGGIEYLKWMQWEYKNGKRIPEETVRLLEQNKISTSDVSFILDRMSPQQVMNYLLRQREQSGKKFTWLLDEWKDTLRMAKQLKTDVNDAIVYRPRDLVVAHDRLAQKINEQNAVKQEREYNKKFPGIGKVCQSLKKYEWSDGKYAVIAPKRVADILAEGRSLNHCVTAERYFERMAKEESYILFLRRSEYLDVPWYTLEVEPGGVIRQKRTKFNRQEKDLDEAKDFLHRWQQEIVKRVGERERALQKASANARQAEIAQLRRDGVVVHGGEMTRTLLADVLLADLMDVG